MARLNKKFQLVVTGTQYSDGDVEKMTLITKEELETLRPLFKDIKEASKQNTWNWSSSDDFYQYPAGDYDNFLVINNAFRDLYNKYYHNFNIQKLVMKTFPRRGYVDGIVKVTINEIKEVESFEFYS